MGIESSDLSSTMLTEKESLPIVINLQSSKGEPYIAEIREDANTSEEKESLGKRSLLDARLKGHRDERLKRKSRSEKKVCQAHDDS